LFEILSTFICWAIIPVDPIASDLMIFLSL
jgi:hypothetical protein